MTRRITLTSSRNPMFAASVSRFSMSIPMRGYLQVEGESGVAVVVTVALARDLAVAKLAAKRTRGY